MQSDIKMIPLTTEVQNTTEDWLKILFSEFERFKEQNRLPYECDAFDAIHRWVGHKATQAAEDCRKMSEEALKHDMVAEDYLELDPYWDHSVLDTDLDENQINQNKTKNLRETQ
jgi:hypothetical protein